MTPPTQYAKCGRISIAYQVLGSGPIDLVHAHGWDSHLEYAWENPDYARFLRRLASFSRLIVSEGGYMAQVLGNCVSNANGGGCSGDWNCGVKTTTPPVLESILDISNNEGTC
jgi:hypothetical protein